MKTKKTTSHAIIFEFEEVIVNQSSLQANDDGKMNSHLPY